MTVEPFFTATVALLLTRLRPPLEAVTAVGVPAGMPDAPPKTTMALPGARVVPDAKVCFTEEPTVIVHPAMLMDVPPTFTSSTNSPAVEEPGSLARISLMITFAGLEEVMVKTALLVSVGVPFWASETRTRAWVVATVGTVHV
jgi:hypothetical protein